MILIACDVIGQRDLWVGTHWMGLVLYSSV